MATSSTTAWAKGFSENPAGEALSAKSIIEMLDRIGDEQVAAPGVPADDPAGGPAGKTSSRWSGGRHGEPANPAGRSVE